MTDHFADRLIDAIHEKNVPACVGFDPTIEKLPPEILDRHGLSVRFDPLHPPPAEACAAAIVSFGREVIAIAARHVPAVKINIAFFEPYLMEGVRAYQALVQAAHEAGLIVIGDVKRADIGHSSERYAAAHLDGDRLPGDPLADAVTVNAYFGRDGTQPFVDVARARGRGVFLLVQTSNASAAEVQGLALSDGGTVSERVGMLVDAWASDPALIGASGYSCVGAVVSPRDVASTVRLRGLMPRCLFLAPGFGAQGRTSKEVAHCFRSDGTGAIVTASRSVIYAYLEPAAVGADWKRCVDRACGEFVAAMRRVVSGA